MHRAGRPILSLLVAICCVPLIPATTAPQGTLAAATARLEHVASLGFTAVQLMPLSEHSDAWGYNPRLLMALHGGYV